ncbi:Xin actin-binding repeat-containing protein 2 [Eufriesea mexicana]|uniref:Xin actin-binding repeat-containing protein 2 n=1 Tax=Eufriesea mexicana TaxID=516756 RepID=A0A310S6J9_9HYME|nr:Xin actin-binding repeat-containing protein 2 [Eufriesea mexicana]
MADDARRNSEDMIRKTARATSSNLAEIKDYARLMSAEGHALKTAEALFIPSESREETITTTSVVSSAGTKGGTKTKKKKIEGVAGNDASPNLTPRTKKTKKSKKSELEKENISVVSGRTAARVHPERRTGYLGFSVFPFYIRRSIRSEEREFPTSQFLSPSIPWEPFSPRRQPPLSSSSAPSPSRNPILDVRRKTTCEPVPGTMASTSGGKSCESSAPKGKLFGNNTPDHGTLKGLESRKPKPNPQRHRSNPSDSCNSVACTVCACLSVCQNSNLQEPSMHPGPRQMNPESLDFSDENDLSNVNVKSLTQNYVSEATRNEQDRCTKEKIATGVSIKQLCRSFGDISNMSDGDQTTYGKANHTMDTEEKARSLGDLRVCEKGYSKFAKDALVFTGVSVKALRASYCSLANLTSEGKDTDRPRLEKSSFNKFDALSKKTVLHVRSIDAGKVQQQLNAQVGQNGDTNPNCRSCGKVVFQMEQTKAEGLVWHKNCFRCVQCSKQLNVDNYESHESTLYCKPHFKELFQPKPVEESDQPVRPRKPELIIRENEPKELPPDVVRASDKPDLGLEELSSLNVKSRFQVFEKAGAETNEIERSPSQIAVKRSPSILSKLAKFQAKGMDIGVADESLNGIPYEESSESEEEEETEETEEVDSEIVKAKRATRERPISFTKMDDIKNRWETTSQQGRREVQREARKEEIAGIRSRLFMGKQGKMKEMYQQAVAGSERVTKINAAEEIQHSTHARSIKERFERGEPIAASDDETDSKPKPEKADEEVIAAGAFCPANQRIFRTR